MKLSLLLLAIMLGCITMSNAQYKNDNVSFKTVYLQDLCKELKSNPDHVLLDVRSQGEFDDTSSYKSMNIGHLANAMHIDIRQMDKRWRELLPYKDKSIFVYCSHSQRSRRVSKMLSDSGFTKVVNINGGMSNIDILLHTGDPCARSLYETANKYKILYPADIVELIDKPDVMILDIRSDSIYRGISLNENFNAYGKLQNAVNIPFADLKTSFSKIPKNKKIILIDDEGDESPDAALLLLENGYTDISVAYDGMDRWVSTNVSQLPAKMKWWVNTTSYHMITAEEFDKLARADKNIVIFDVRSTVEFNNRHKEYWRNRGHIKNAINIPSDTLKARLNELETYKNRPIVVYHFSGQSESFDAAKLLTENGFRNVNVLLGGIWDLRWKAANIKGDEYLKDWVTDVPPDNQ